MIAFSNHMILPNNLDVNIVNGINYKRKVDTFIDGLRKIEGV